MSSMGVFDGCRRVRLKPGKLADIVVLSRDILTCPENDIPDTKVLYTIVGGKVLYEQK